MQLHQGFFLMASLIFVLAEAGNDPLSCQDKSITFDSKWQTMEDACIKKMKDQVSNELHAAIAYLSMGAHFSQDSINRPGFAKMFFEAASEEREHAMKIISYLLMRGSSVSAIAELIKRNKVLTIDETSWGSGIEALKAALALEVSVTQNIRDIITTCEGGSNDYHLVDYLTGDFLEEQYQGQRDIAGKISTLGKMMDSHKSLGEFLFDKKLLSGESV